MTPEKNGETRYSCGVCGHTIGLSTSDIVGVVEESQLNYLHKKMVILQPVLEQILASRRNNRVTNCAWRVQKLADKPNLA